MLGNFASKRIATKKVFREWPWNPKISLKVTLSLNFLEHNNCDNPSWPMQEDCRGFWTERWKKLIFWDSCTCPKKPNFFKWKRFLIFTRKKTNFLEWKEFLTLAWKTNFFKSKTVMFNRKKNKFFQIAKYFQLLFKRK